MSDITILKKGFSNFHDTYFKKDPTLYDDFYKNGQKPKTLVIACSDSRVDPAILFGSKPGDLFVVRNVANLIPCYQSHAHADSTSAAIEYAVRDLKVCDIVILGHSFCGGIAALKELINGNTIPRECITQWISAPVSCLHAHSTSNKDLEQQSIIHSMDNLATFPWVKERLDQNSLHIHGWWFNMEDGFLWEANAQDKTFTLMPNSS